MFLPMLDSKPELWPLDEGDDAARLLTWRGPGGGAAASLEDVLIATLRFVAGAVPPTAYHPRLGRMVFIIT